MTFGEQARSKALKKLYTCFHALTVWQICDNFWVDVNTALSSGEKLQLWIGTKTFIPKLKIAETPGFMLVDADLSVASQNAENNLAADLSTLRLPQNLPCGGSYLVAIIADSVSMLSLNVVRCFVLPSPMRV